MNDYSSYPLVTIGMPVWNGEKFLNDTIDSLLAQTYKNFELLILDNLSTDRTAEICKFYENRDSRVRYILDTEHCDVIVSHNKIAKMASGSYFMVACDDDVYDNNYILKLMNLFFSNSNLGMSYSGWRWIDEKGLDFKGQHTFFLKYKNSLFLNFGLFLFRRMPIPFVFGIYRLDVHNEGLKFFLRPDERGWDHDTLYVLRVLSICKVESTNEVLFNYRYRDREKLYEVRKQGPKSTSISKQFIDKILHEASFTKMVAKIIIVSKFNLLQKIFGLLFSILIFVYNISGLKKIVLITYKYFNKQLNGY
jgi:glycosyltransferase involved in cell wall biosynthesis